jgi:hypothetical protein
MKKILLKISVIIGLIGSSCSETENTEIGKNDNYRVMPDYIQTSFSEQQFPLDYLHSGNSIVENFNIYKDIATQYAILEGTVFKSFIEALSSFYNTDLSNYTISGIVFYGDEVSVDLVNFNNLTLIVLDNEGYSKYISYKVNGSSLDLVNDNPQKHSFVMLNYFGYLGNTLNISNTSLLTVFNSDDNITVSPTIIDNIKPENIELTVLNEYPIIPYSYRGGHFCTMEECDSTSRGFCGPDNKREIVCQGSSYVEDNECADDNIGGPHKPNETISESLVYRVAMYSIRDNFLLPTTKGKEYVDYYYKISYVFNIMGIYDQEKEDLEELFTFIRSKAIDFITLGSEAVMIDSTEYSYLENKIQKYKEFSNNEEYQFIFENITDDLAAIKDKTKADIIRHLE